MELYGKLGNLAVNVERLLHASIIFDQRRLNP